MICMGEQRVNHKHENAVGRSSAPQARTVSGVFIDEGSVMENEGFEDTMQRTSRYIIEGTEHNILVRGRPHPFESEGYPDWLMDLAYDWVGGRREPVQLVQKPYKLVVESAAKRVSFGFYDFPRILDCMAQLLMGPWTPAERARTRAGDQFGSERSASWAMKRTAWALNKRIHTEWKRLLARVNPTVLAVHRAVFAAAYGRPMPDVVTDPRLYREKYIVKDITAYRAAAVAAWGCEWLGEKEDPVQKMLNWRKLFSPVGTYRALDRTLMHLPGGVPAPLLLDLNKIILPRPIVNRLELITTVYAGNHYPRRLPVFALARADQIAEAIRRISAHICHDLSPRRTTDVCRAIQFLLDYPDDHQGNIVGLANKTIRWHRDCWRAGAEKATRCLPDDLPTALPRIPLPQIEGVRFLETVGDLRNESEQMHHCIRQYAKRASDGLCYLFHVEHAGESASVEVSPGGFVVQSHGPSNRDNHAVKWGRTILNQWAAGMRIDNR